MKTTRSERDYAFGIAMMSLRTKIGLTQAGLAKHLGISRLAVGKWEAGSSYPRAEYLTELMALGVKSQAFPAGHEAEEIRSFWKSAHQKVLLDEYWLFTLLSQQSCKPSDTNLHSEERSASEPASQSVSGVDPVKVASMNTKTNAQWCDVEQDVVEETTSSASLSLPNAEAGSDSDHRGDPLWSPNAEAGSDSDHRGDPLWSPNPEAGSDSDRRGDPLWSPNPEAGSDSDRRGDPLWSPNPPPQEISLTSAPTQIETFLHSKDHVGFLSTSHTPHPKTDKTRKRRKWLLPSLIALVILTIIGSAGAFFFQTRRDATATDAYPAYLSGKGKLVFFDPLNQQAGSYWASIAATNTRGTCQFIGGAYHVSTQQRINSFSWCLADEIFSNFAIEVQLTITQTWVRQTQPLTRKVLQIKETCLNVCEICRRIFPKAPLQATCIGSC